MRKVLPKWRWSMPFSGKSPLTNLQTLTHQISLLAGSHQACLKGPALSVQVRSCLIYDIYGQSGQVLVKIEAYRSGQVRSLVQSGHLQVNLRSISGHFKVISGQVPKIT